MTDDTAFVDEVGHPTPAVTFPDRFFRVGSQGKVDTIFSSELYVFLQAICTHSDNFGIQLLEFFQIPLESFDFIGSDRCKDGKVQCQNDILFASEFSQTNGSMGGFSSERRRFVANLYSKCFDGCEKQTGENDHGQGDVRKGLHFFLLLLTDCPKHNVLILMKTNGFGLSILKHCHIALQNQGIKLWGCRLFHSPAFSINHQLRQHGPPANDGSWGLKQFRFVFG
jgi:hypothetical protein